MSTLSYYVVYTPPLQVHLTEEEFSKVFGMSTHEYRPLPQWKKNNIKKKVDLF